MKRKPILLIAIFCLFFGFNGCAFLSKTKTKKEKTLKEKVADEIRYISTPEEREALKKLDTEEETKDFVEKFWKKADPTPGTPENELRTEYYKRFEYANKHYADHREGWKTDQGRIYILYGPPDIIDQEPWVNIAFNGGLTAKSLEVWVYFKMSGNMRVPAKFSNLYPKQMKFIFADMKGFGMYTQIYSTEEKEEVYPFVYTSNF